MVPSFRIYVDDLDTTLAMNRRLLEVQITDQMDLVNDRISLKFDDRPPYIKIPQTGKEITFDLGYVERPGHSFPSKIKRMGVFIFDEYSCSKGTEGRTFTMTGHAADSESTFKEPRTEEYHETTLGDIVHTCARRNDLEPVVERALGIRKIPHENQTNTSDAAYLDYLAQKNGGVMKVQGGKLFFATRGQVAKLMDFVLPDVVLNDEEILNYSFLTQGKGRYTAVRAYYYDKDKGQRAAVVSNATTSREEVYYTLPRTYPNEEEAKVAANAKKEQLDRSQASLTLSCIGTPKLMAESTVKLVGFRPDVIDRWQLTKVVHKYTKGGYICDCTAENPLAPKGLIGIDGKPLTSTTNSQ